MVMPASGVRRSCETAVSSVEPTRLEDSRAVVARRIASISCRSRMAVMRAPWASIISISDGLSSRLPMTRRSESPIPTWLTDSPARLFFCAITTSGDSALDSMVHHFLSSLE